MISIKIIDGLVGGQMKNKSKKPSAVDKSQEPLDYRIIEKLREEAWARPQVQKNWEEFDKKQKQNSIK